jgi:hypothetical protein
MIKILDFDTSWSQTLWRAESPGLGSKNISISIKFSFSVDDDPADLERVRTFLLALQDLLRAARTDLEGET